MDIQLSKWQTEFLKHFDDPLVCAVTGISSGKSYVLSLWLVLQCIKNAGIRGICIAQNYKALTRVLFTEIRSRCTELGVAVEEKASDCSMRFTNGSILFGYSAENPESLLGLTNISLLAIDEAAYVPESIYNYARDRMRGTDISRTRLISSPVNGPVMNWFSKVCDSAITVRATALDNPFTSQAFKAELKMRYGEGSVLYRQQVLGEIFDASSSSALVNRSDITIGSVNGGLLYAGYDASGLGADKDVLTISNDKGLVDSIILLETDTVAKANKIQSILSARRIRGLYYDATGGYGNGVGDILKANGVPNVVGINFAQAAYDKDKFPNARTEMYIELRDAVRNGFTVSSDISDELCAMSLTINSRGLVQLVSKDAVREILGHSPDSADSLALSVYCRNHFDSGISSDRCSEIAERYLNALLM
jgi:hypothetical protein